MSTLAEKVELDAAIAEAELTDDEAAWVRHRLAEFATVAEAIEVALNSREPEGDGAATPAPAEPEGDEPTAKQFAALAKEQARHEARVRDVMGGFVAGFVSCEHCNGVGLVPPGPEPRTHDWFHACATCAGFGDVLTGSLKQGQEARACPDCAGRGYVEALDSSGGPLATRGGASDAGPQTHPASPPPTVPEQNGGAQPPASFGVPAWMGDPTLSG